MGNLLIQNRALAYHLRRFVPSDCPDCCGGKGPVQRPCLRYVPADAVITGLTATGEHEAYACCAPAVPGQTRIVELVTGSYSYGGAPTAPACQVFTCPSQSGLSQVTFYNAPTPCVPEVTSQSPANGLVTVNYTCLPGTHRLLVTASFGVPIIAPRSLSADINLLTGQVTAATGYEVVSSSSFTFQCTPTGYTFSVSIEAEDRFPSGTCSGQPRNRYSMSASGAVSGMTNISGCSSSAEHSCSAESEPSEGGGSQAASGCLGCPQDGGLTA